MSKDHEKDFDLGGSSIFPAANAAAAGAAAQNPMDPLSGSVGSIGSPSSTVTIGMVGGLVGTTDHEPIGNRLNPEKEFHHWRNAYLERDDIDHDQHDYEHYYAPAYRYGWESFAREYNEYGKETRPFTKVEKHLAKDWNKHRTDNDLTWDQAESSVKAAYDRAFLILQDK